MKAYKDLSKEVGHLKLQELKFPEVKHYQPGGGETSLAGKMKTRPRRRHPASSSLNGHTDYIGESLARIGEKECVLTLMSPTILRFHETEGGCLRRQL